MEDAGFALFESMATNLYLVRKHGAGSAVAPRSPEEALVLQWSFWAVAELEKPLLTLLLGALGIRAVDGGASAAARGELGRPLGVLDRHLSGRPWLLADRFTAADLNVAAVLDWTRPARLGLSPHPRVGDWLSRCLGRPAFAGLSLG